MLHPTLTPTIVTYSPAGLPWVTDKITGQRLRPAVISGGDGPTDDDGDEDGGDGGSGTDGPKYTRQQLDSQIGRAAKKARQDAAKELADQLGMSVADAKAFIEAKRKAEQESMSEADQKLAQAQQIQAQAEAAMAEAATAKRDAKVTLKLAAAQVKPKAIGLVVPALGLEPDADDDDIDAAIARVRDDLPELFAGTNDDGSGKPPPSSNNGGTRRKNAPPPASSFEAGMEAGKQYASRYAPPNADLPVF
jgi:membrane protein involved in colicin uptake